MTPDATFGHALALARSLRTPARATPPPRRPYPWTGTPLALPATAPDPDGPVDLDHLLRHSLRARPGTGGRLRPAASAGALHPVRAHLLIGPGCTLPPGRYAYDAEVHRVFRRGPAPRGAAPGVIAVLTVTAAHTAAHYGHRAWPLLLLDTGHTAAALALAPQGPGVRVSLDTDAATLAAAAGLPPADRWQRIRPGTETEHPLAAVQVTPRRTQRTAPALDRWAALPLPHRTRTPTRPPARPCGTGRLLELLGAATGTEPAWHPVRRPATVTGRALLERRSADPATLGHPPDGETVARLLHTAATAWPGGPAWCAAVATPAPALLAPGHHTATPYRLARGDARPSLAHWAAGQLWLADTGAALLAHGCPSDAPASQIRHDHLAAGFAAGTAHAHAAAEGINARPVGSWQQADLGAALGDTPGHDWVLHGLALGAAR
ncbi:nitroreductase [Streptomyces sp. CBG31]|uniref:nitroreductase n=1 Tax=Streptomyces sp. CBG31 TaxID=2762623 RepID=UPI0023D83680|nr:nitroreductase [Streptomyces sp. CBG31]